jgi:YggT family protein
MIGGMAARIIVGVADFYVMLIFVYVLMSWIPHNDGFIGEVYDVLGSVCEPYLKIFRSFIPPIGGMMDISPIVAIFVLQLVVRLIV